MWTRVMEVVGRITAATTAIPNQPTSTYLTATTRGITGMKAPYHKYNYIVLALILINFYHSSRFAGYFQSRPGTSYASTQGSNSYNGNSWQARIFCVYSQTVASLWMECHCLIPACKKCHYKYVGPMLCNALKQPLTVGTAEVWSIFRRDAARGAFTWWSCQTARV